MQNQIVHKVPPVYPEEAKKERIQGKVELDAVIGKTGAVEELKVISGPNELQQSALDAVRQWTYRPFLVNGAPVDVKTTIHVVYMLAK
jgi:TonB family protein